MRNGDVAGPEERRAVLAPERIATLIGIGWRTPLARRRRIYFRNGHPAWIFTEWASPRLGSACDLPFGQGGRVPSITKRPALPSEARLLGIKPGRLVMVRQKTGSDYHTGQRDSIAEVVTPSVAGLYKRMWQFDHPNGIQLSQPLPLSRSLRMSMYGV